VTQERNNFRGSQLPAGEIRVGSKKTGVTEYPGIIRYGEGLDPRFTEDSSRPCAGQATFEYQHRDVGIKVSSSAAVWKTVGAPLNLCTLSD
jgi:hypothetical protein